MAIIDYKQIVERRKDEYYLALRKSQEIFSAKGGSASGGKTEPTDASAMAGRHDTISPWLNFFLSVVKEQATKALAYLEKEKVEDMLSPKQYEVWKYLSSIDEASPGEIIKATSIVRGTVKQALDRLVELGKVKRVGLGRGTRYVKL